MRIFEGIDGDFSPSDVLRGRAYAAEGRVDLVECTPTRIRARVNGTAPYRVEIAIVDGEQEYACSCPAFERTYACKHLWATIEVARRHLAGGIADPSPRAAARGSTLETTATRFPPGRSQAQKPRGDTLDADELFTSADTDASVGAGAGAHEGKALVEARAHALDARSRAGRASMPEDFGTLADLGAELAGLARRGDSWRARLAALSAATPFTPTSDRARAVLYGIEPAQHGDACRLLAYVAGARRGSNATWRRMRGIDLGGLGLEDRAIVEALPDPEGGFDGFGPETWWSLGPEWQAVFVPRLVATGRLHLARGGRLDPTPLALDDASVYAFRVSLSRVPAALPTRLVPSAATMGREKLAVPTRHDAAVRSARGAASANVRAPGTDSSVEAPVEAVVEHDLWLRGELHRSTPVEDVVAIDACDAVFGAGFCVRGAALARVDWRGAASWAFALRRGAGVRMPASALDEALDTLTTCPGTAEIVTHDVLATIRATPRPILRLFGVDPRTGCVPAELACDYDGVVLVVRETQRFFRRGLDWVRVARDAEAEARFERTLDASHVVHDGHHDVRRAVEVPELSRVVETLTRDGWLVEAEGVPLRGASEPHIHVRSGIDWFDVNVDVDFGVARAELPELLRALREKRRFVTLSDGSLGVLPERWLRSWEMLSVLGTVASDGEGVRVARGSAWLLSAWLDEHEAHVDVDAGFAAWRERLHAGLSPRARPEPDGFQGELRPYQREGLGWLECLREIGSGGCLADDMGLGKTVMVLAMILARRADARGPALVVAPASVVFNWQREAQRFTPSLDVRVHHGTARDRAGAGLAGADIVVTTYGTLRRDVDSFSKVEFDCAVLDEAQTIKNPSSQVARSTRALKARARFALTGTPVENHLGDLFSIFQFVEPDLFRGSPRVREWLRGAKDDVELARVVSRGLRPFLLRRRKEDVLLDLPAKTEQLVECALLAPQRRAYDELRRHFRDELLGKNAPLDLSESRMNVLEALLRLRQAACHPGLIDPTQSEADSGKLEALLPMLEDVAASGHKGLVFSQFTSFLAIVRARLDERGIAYEYLDGRTKKREERVDRFQNDPEVPLFLVSLKAGGVGLNLTAADYVFLLDPWWNPAVEAQAIDRSHRIGQTRAVTAYRFVAVDTVEEKVLALQEKKRALATALFDSAGATLRDLTREDLEWLLT